MFRPLLCTLARGEAVERTRTTDRLGNARLPVCEEEERLTVVGTLSIEAAFK